MPSISEARAASTYRYCVRDLGANGLAVSERELQAWRERSALPDELLTVICDCVTLMVVSG